MLIWGLDILIYEQTRILYLCRKGKFIIWEKKIGHASKADIEFVW
jgi:hypothetical protein